MLTVAPPPFLFKECSQTQSTCVLKYLNICLLIWSSDIFPSGCSRDCNPCGPVPRDHEKIASKLVDLCPVILSEMTNHNKQIINDGLLKRKKLNRYKILKNKKYF